MYFECVNFAFLKTAGFTRVGGVSLWRLFHNMLTQQYYFC